MKNLMAFTGKTGKKGPLPIIGGGDVQEYTDEL
jgi:hypothetical protein